MDQAHRTQVWLAVGNGAAAQISGEYFYHMERRSPNPQARDQAFQDQLLSRCRELTNIPLPFEAGGEK